MKRFYEVWYVKDEFFREAMFGQLKPTGDLEDTHVEVCEVEAENHEDVFRKMQAEYWSPNGEARPLIERLGLSHTSMSVGDVVYDAMNGKAWLVENFGWRQL